MYNYEPEYNNINKVKQFTDTILGWIILIGKMYIFTYIVSLIFTPRPKKIKIQQPSIEDDMKTLYEYYKEHGNICPHCNLYYSKNTHSCIECGCSLIPVKLYNKERIDNDI